MADCHTKLCSREQSCLKEIGHPGKCKKNRKRDFYKSSPICIEKERTNKINQLDNTINPVEEKKLSYLLMSNRSWHSIINNTHAIKGWNFNFRALISYAHILCLIKIFVRDVIIYAKYFDCGLEKKR